MTKQLRLAVPLALVALSVACASAFGGSTVLVHPVKGATYAGTLLHAGTITIKVARNGQSAKVSLARVPAFCQGGSGPQKQSSKPATISRTGALKVTIAYTTTGRSAPFAHVTVAGNFFTFSGEKPVFDGTVKSTFAAAASKECDGQESFAASEL
jgi:proline racemase